jgi:hypothetical protein
MRQRTNNRSRGKKKKDEPISSITSGMWVISSKLPNSKASEKQGGGAINFFTRANAYFTQSSYGLPPCGWILAF